MKHPKGKEIQLCSNKVPSLTPGGYSFIDIYVYRETVKKSSQELLHQLNGTGGMDHP